MATIVCDYCGATLSLTQKYCRDCGKKNDLAASAVNAVNPVVPISLKSNITPPYIVSNPTDMDIYHALLSPTNPYSDGQWGRLILDDNENHIWEEHTKQDQYKNVEASGFYVGNVYRLCQGSYPADRAKASLREKISVRDFALQFQVQIYLYSSNASVYFRYVPEREFGYVLDFSNAHYKLWTHSIDELAMEDRCPAIRNGRANLVAIVAQENVLDLYINLIHVKRIVDTSILFPGTIGLRMFQACSEFSYTKLWVKDTD
jgi:hypothetical protein